MGDISQRDAFWGRIYDLARADTNLIVLSADMGAPALDRFRRDLPAQFINVGIAEQNGIAVAAGLALAGKKVFAYAIAPFITLRCLEQVRVECAMMKIPLTLVGVGAGFSYDDSGPTHHLIEDIAIMRSLPNLTIHSVTDRVMARATADIAYRENAPGYVRLDRQVLPDIYGPKDEFDSGISVLAAGKEAFLVTTGTMAHVALGVAARLAKKKMNVGVIDAYRFPLNVPRMIEILRQARKIITLEEHFLAGGLGGAICELLADHGILTPVKRIGIPNERGYCYEYGGRQVIRAHYGIDDRGVEKTVADFLMG